MKTFLAAALLAAGALAASASPGDLPSRPALPTEAPPASFRAPGIAPVEAAALGPSLFKATGERMYPGGPMWVANVRAMPKSQPVSVWREVPGGYVARLKTSAEGAVGLRARFDLGTVPGSFELRAAGEDGRVFSMEADPTKLGNEIWGPWTDGPVQVVEVFSRVRPSEGALSLGALLHFDVGAQTKAASACTVSTHCSTTNPAFDAAIAEGKKSVLRINGVSSGRGFLCSATLINTPKFPDPYVLTANHCVSTVAEAASLATRWFWETTSCADTSASSYFEGVGGGMQLVFTNFHVDSSLLLMNSLPPGTAVYAGLNTARLTGGTPVISLSHPTGDAQRLAVGSVTGEIRPRTSDLDYPQDMYRVIFTQGATEGGSSGSGLFTVSNGSLRIAGVLFGGTIGDTCTTTRDGIYGRLEILYPQIAPYIGTAVAPDDTPNRVSDYAGAVVEPSLETVPTRLFAGRTIAPAGDIDVYQFRLANPGTVAVWSESAIDIIGSLLDSTGAPIAGNDDASITGLDFGITRTLAAGTYYVSVGHFDALGQGAYSLKMRAFDLGATNYTDLWWNAAESGWGINLSHQDRTIVATLYTYDLDGTPMWLILSNGERQGDGSFSGALYRVTGPAFNASPWTAITPVQVGTMRLAFNTATSGTLTYTVNGVSVTKAITRYVFDEVPECTWSAFDRSYATNVQDLWWNQNESGWGINFAHQGDTIFATLYTYAPNGKAMWYSMSNGELNGDGSFSGTLYRTTGPAFNASPWTAINAVPVGTMQVTFKINDQVFRGGGSNRATLTYTVDGVTVTKEIQRYDFGNVKAECKIP